MCAMESNAYHLSYKKESLLQAYQFGMEILFKGLNFKLISQEHLKPENLKIRLTIVLRFLVLWEKLLHLRQV